MTTADRDLIAAFTRRLAIAGCPEPAVLAQELAAIATGHGWHHVPPLDERPDHGPPLDPAEVHQHAANIRRQLRGDTP